jgi:Flp pilus assembly protein TadG
MTMTMIQRIQHVRDDERGMSIIFVSLGFMAFLSATTLAIDVGMLMTARTQAQNAADAGALAGATALAFNSFTNQSASGPAVTSAINAATANLVIGQAPSVTFSDVTFPKDPVTGEFDAVQVLVHRTQARGNPVATLIAQIFGVQTVDINATATAGAVPANAELCVLPLTIPDKWTEKQSPADSFDMFDDKGNLLSNPDVYVPPGQTGATGYNPDTDKGLQLVLKTNNGTKVAPSMYNPWDLPGSVGGNDYRDNIAGCNPNLVKMGDSMTPENGNMVGPTKQGTDDLMAQDPNAHWDTFCDCVKGSAFPVSPRIRVVPLYDPVLYAQGQQSGKSGPQLQVVNYVGFFIESNGGGEVVGRMTPILGKISGKGPPSIGGFARVLMLVQ